MKLEIEKPNFAGFNRIILVDEKGNKQYAKMPKKARTVMDAVLDREDGPAKEYLNGYKAHYKDGKLHGVVEFAGKVCSVWKNGVRVE